MPQPIDYDGIVDRLSELTAQGKLAWSTIYTENAFVCVLEQGAFTFKIDRFRYDDDDRVAFSMTDKENNEIFRVSEGLFTPLGRKLSELHEDARRSALRVEEKIDAVKNILGRI